MISDSNAVKFDDIEIEEMPQGCIINQKNKSILISSPRDACALIISLTEMLKSQYFRAKENK
jgi:hypothetical protein